ncbi:MAG: hypothetical protein E7628_01630 [Ruminococcaceae bacterium]|nr:hypothetical protein [Oscillospiraceae bacterium]
MKIGFGKADITPAGKVALQGQFNVRIAEKIHSRIYTTAMAIETEGRITVWASVDLLHIMPPVPQMAAERIAAFVPGFTHDDIAISATHTHTAPYVGREQECMLCSFKAEEKLYDDLTTPEEYALFVADSIADAVKQATESMEECYTEVAVSRIMTSYSRRTVYKEGYAVMYGSTHEANFLKMENHDGGPMSIIYAKRATDGELKGIVANVPCPAQVIENQCVISSDFWGYTRDYMEKHIGNIPLVSLSGSAGDLSPRDLLSTIPGEVSMWEEEGCRDLGEKIGREIVALKDAPLYRNEGEAYHFVKHVDLPIWNPTDEEYEKATLDMAALEKKYGKSEGELIIFEETDGTDVFELCSADTIIGRQRRGRKIVDGAVHLLRMGKTVLISNPYELFVEYADRIKAACPEAHVLDVQMTDDDLNYLPTPDAMKRGGYSAVIFACQSGADAGEVLVRESIAAVREIIKK